MAHLRRHHKVGSGLHLFQLGSIVLLAMCHPEGTLQYRNMFVGYVPMWLHFELSFRTDTDHVQTALLVRVAGDDGDLPGMRGFQTSSSGVTMTWRVGGFVAGGFAPCARAKTGISRSQQTRA